MAWHEVATLSDLTSKQRMVVEIKEKKILLIWHENEVHAVQAKCPHLGLPLIKSKIENNEIICPFHKSAFDLCDGEVKCWSPWPKLLGGVLGMVSKQKNLEVYPVQIDEDKVMVKI
jgi:nitrite reductase/ring-hydroxylating ferredoxin subunit